MSLLLEKLLAMTLPNKHKKKKRKKENEFPLFWNGRDGSKDKLAALLSAGLEARDGSGDPIF